MSSSSSSSNGGSSSSSGGSWGCQTCTFINGGEGFTCQVCGSVDVQRQQQMQQVQSNFGWMCKSCTYLNPYMSDDELSGSANQGQPSLPPGGGVSQLMDQAQAYNLSDGPGGVIGGGFAVAMMQQNPQGADSPRFQFGGGRSGSPRFQFGGDSDYDSPPVGMSPRTAAQFYTCEVCGSIDRERRIEFDKKKQDAEKKRWERIQRMRAQKQEEERRKKEEAERQKLAKEEQEKREAEQLKERIRVFLPLYEEVYSTCMDLDKRKSHKQSPDRVFEIARTLFRYSHLADLLDSKQDEDVVMIEGPPTCCQVCFSDFDAETRSIKASHCGHAMTCARCFQQYISIRLRDGETMPWIPCPHADCTVPLHPDDILNSGIDAKSIFMLFRIHIQRHISRDANWIECVRDGCEYGFYIEGDTSTKKQKCRACGKRQVVQRKSDKADEEFQKMVEKGELRPCPKCEDLQMKDYGICNVIQCPKCSIWWNWRSRETGRTERELKNRSRMRGTLWEPGELNYQRRLESQDPKAFQTLLEKNGIQYDPNYVRGT